MGSSCSSVEQPASRAQHEQQKTPQFDSPKQSEDSPKAAAPKRFVSVINDKDLTQHPIPNKSTGSPTNRPRGLSIDSCGAVSSVCDELSVDAGGATPSNSFYSSRASPKSRTSVSFVHSNDVIISDEDLTVPYDTQLASPRCPGTWSQRSGNVAGVLGNSGEATAQ